MRRGITFGALALALLIPVNGCGVTPADAAVRAETTGLALVAAGDTVKATDYVRITGNPDSVVVIFTMRAAPPQTARRGAGNGAVAFGPVLLIPSPVYADGDTATVSACPIAWKRGQSFSQPCGFALYTRNDPPVIEQDSVVVSFQLWPDTVTVLMGDTVRFMTVATYRDGHVGTYMRDYAVRQEAGVQVVWANLQGFADTSRIRVLTSPHEPATFTAFASFSGGWMPPFPRGPAPKGACAWCGGWI